MCLSIINFILQVAVSPSQNLAVRPEFNCTCSARWFVKKMNNFHLTVNIFSDTSKKYNLGVIHVNLMLAIKCIEKFSFKFMLIFSAIIIYNTNQCDTFLRVFIIGQLCEDGEMCVDSVEWTK